jgi:protein-S-isoprenylcysteine O-methyltransferase Ste14
MEIVIAACTMLLAVSSLWFSIAAVLTLGKNWSYIAAVSPRHQLVTRGPYRYVRHPIYTGMLGLCVATGLAASQWWALPIAFAVFATGTWIRVRIEDQLLRATHGTAFADYARRVPALFPRWSRRTER